MREQFIEYAASVVKRDVTLTCDSDIPRAYANLARSGPARYLVCSKVFSRAKICCPLNVGLVCFFLPPSCSPAPPPVPAIAC